MNSSARGNTHWLGRGRVTIEALLEELDTLGEELYLLLGQGGPSLKLLELFLRSRRCHHHSCAAAVTTRDL
jgi:hypothetical protein